MAVRTGTGCSITLASSDYDVNILAVSDGGASIPVVDTTHLGTTTARTKIVGDLIDFGEWTIEIHIDPDKLDLMKTTMEAGAQTVTFTWKKISGEPTNAATVSGSAALTAHSFTVPLEDIVTGTYTLSWLGDVTYADSAA